MKRFKEWFRMYEMALGHTFNKGGGYFQGTDRKIMGEMFPKIELGTVVNSGLKNYANFSLMVLLFMEIKFLV